LTLADIAEPLRKLESKHDRSGNISHEQKISKSFTCLESLEDLGILLSHNEDGMIFWHLAEL
jgi:hypothetical protein